MMNYEPFILFFILFGSIALISISLIFQENFEGGVIEISSPYRNIGELGNKIEKASLNTNPQNHVIAEEVSSIFEEISIRNENIDFNQQPNLTHMEKNEKSLQDTNLVIDESISIILENNYLDNYNSLNLIFSRFDLQGLFTEIIPNIASLLNLFASDFIKFSEDFYEAELSFSDLTKEKLITDPNILCKPLHYGFTDWQVSTITQKRDYGDCAKTQIIKKVDLDSNLVEIECSRSAGGQFLIGTHPDQELMGSVDYNNFLPSFSGKVNVNLEDSEFLIVKCGQNNKQAFLHNKFSETASIRATYIREGIKQKLGLSSNKPFGVYVIMIDSMSRYLFYRSLPQTVNFLNEILKDSSNDVQIYDFLVNNPAGANTRPNLAPLFYGRSLEKHSKLRENLKVLRNEFDTDEIMQEGSLWKFFEKLGFVTMFGYDTIWNFFVDDNGRKVFTDHKVLNFWRAAKKLLGYADFVQRQMCFGDKHHHRYIFDYINQYASNYKFLHRFAYHHISTAHENSMNKAKTLDKDMKEFLEKFFEVHQKEDFVLMITSDHGMLNMPYKFIEGVFENRTPVHLIISNKSFISKIGKNTDEILRHNSQRLISRYDWHLTLKHLALMAYGNIGKDSETYKFLMKNNENIKAYSLFLEKIPDERTCQDASISDFMCLCRDWKNLPLFSNIVEFISENIIQNTVDYINKYEVNGQICKQIVMGKIVEAKEYLAIEQELKFLIITVEYRQDPRVKFDFKIILEKSGNEKQKERPIYKIKYPTAKYKDLSDGIEYRVYAEFLTIKNNETCNRVAESALINHDICICKL